MSLTKTMRSVLHLLVRGHNPYCGSVNHGSRARCLYAMQGHGLIDNATSGWKLTPAGRKAAKS